MSELITNEKGNISIALALAALSLACCLTLMLQVTSGTAFTRNDCDRLQQFNLLRSECSRAEAIVEKIEFINEGIVLPAKYVTIPGSLEHGAFLLQTRVMLNKYMDPTGLYKNKQYRVMSLASITTHSGSGQAPGPLISSVRTYSEKLIRRSTLAGYHYLTDTEQSTNGTRVYFWGPDVIYGKVHTNTDIWLKQAGGGTNNGWPTFFGEVYTAGQIQSFSGTPPYSQVFRQGYFEHADNIEFNLTAQSIRTNGIPVGPTDYNPNRILFVKVGGAAYHSMIGTIVSTCQDTADVWTMYPPPSGEFLFRNRFARYDTLWTRGPSGSIVNRSAIVYSKLWIEGSFHGAQTWCAVDTMYITANCILMGTPIGANPDGVSNGSTYNHTDILGLVSEKSILVKYGYKDPEDNVRYRKTSGSSAQSLWIYAALCALGDGGDPHEDGVFSFEYQHPHPATPNTGINGNPQVWKDIDLHRYTYPPTANHPWPGNVDYPYYNPLWPERYPLMERGTIHLRGSVAQRRKGYVHRGTADAEYPNPSNIWNIPLDLCGSVAGGPIVDPILGFSSGGVNADGASGTGVGYNKDYVYDYRMDTTAPPDYPELFIAGRRAVYDEGEWYFKRPPANFTGLK